MSDNIESSEQLSDEQIDNLVDRSERPSNQEIPMKSLDKEASAKDVPTESEKFLEFTHNGKPIKAPIDQVIKWAQQGYDYPQKMNQFKQQQTQWSQERQQWEQKIAPYRQIDEWAAKNPDKWQALEQSWKQSQYAQAPQGAHNPNDQFSQKFQNLESKLSQIEQFTQQQMQEKQAAQRQQEDTKLADEIKSIREQYKDLDFNQVDESGKSLEFRVLEHAAKNGIAKFSTAFRDFYHDNLIARAAAQAKQDVSKGIQRNSKLGLLGQSPSPKKGFSQVKDPKSQSYEELAREALDELRAGA